MFLAELSAVRARQLAEVNGAVGKPRASPLGRPKRLDAEQIETLSLLLVTGALRAGFAAQLGAVRRTRSVIAREFGVEYGQTRWRWLLQDMGLPSQQAEKRSAGRDQAANWKPTRLRAP